MYCHPSFRLLSPTFTLVSGCDLSCRPLIAFSSAVIISCSRWALMTMLTCWDGLVVSQGASVVSFSVISAFSSQITWLQCLIRVKDEVSLWRRTDELLLRPLSPAGRKMVNFVQRHEDPRFRVCPLLTLLTLLTRISFHLRNRMLMTVFSAQICSR